MQKQVIPINKSTENKLIKIIVVSLLSILSLLFVIVLLIILVHFSITLPINFYKYNFYGLNIDLVYTTCHIDIRKYLDSTCTLYRNLLYQQNLHYNRIYKYHYSKFVYYCILTNLINIRIYNFCAIIHYKFHLISSKNYKLSYLFS